MFSTEKERKDWLELINKQLNGVKIKSTNGNKTTTSLLGNHLIFALVFGCPLSELLKKDPKNPKVPFVVKTLVTELEKRTQRQHY